MRNPARSPMWRRPCAAWAAALLVAPWPGIAAALPVQVSIGRLAAGDVVVHDLEIATNAAGTQLSLSAGHVELAADWRAAQVTLDCGDDGWAGDSPCSGGAWSLALGPVGGQLDWQVPVSGTLGPVDFGGPDWRVQSSIGAGPLAGTLEAAGNDAGFTGTLDWRDQPLVGIEQLPLPPSPVDWLFEGTFSGSVGLNVPADGPTALEFRIDTTGLSFDSPEGLYAAAQLDVGVSGSATVGDALELRATTEITGGELLVDRFYATFDDTPLRVETRGALEDSTLRLEQLRVADGEALEILAMAETRLDAPLESLDWRVDRLEMHFPMAYERYLESMLGPLTLDGLTVTGSVVWQGSGRPGAYPEGELDVSDLSIVDTQRGRFAVTGLDASLQVGTGPDDSRIAWRGLLFQKINLGAGEAVVETRPGAFELAEPLRLGVLGGELVFDRVGLVLPPDDAPPEAESEVTIQASLQGMEMAQLTQALGWPRFEGEISGTIPGVSLEGGVLEVDGEIDIAVFDGRLRLYGLRIERLFGVLPSLAANLEVENVDLERLTRTFSFGRITGRMDGYVRGLRMLDWEPVAFDAWFGTPADQKAGNDISRKAVNHLTTIGGGGPTAALTGPLLSLFNNFSYRRIGIGCVLEDYVCRLRGLDDDREEGVLIMEGSGIPNITIRAYNRRMDFPQLVANLQAAAGGEGVRIGDGP